MCMPLIVMRTHPIQFIILVSWITAPMRRVWSIIHDINKTVVIKLYLKILQFSKVVKVSFFFSNKWSKTMNQYKYWWNYNGYPIKLSGQHLFKKKVPNTMMWSSRMSVYSISNIWMSGKKEPKIHIHLHIHSVTLEAFYTYSQI